MGVGVKLGMWVTVVGDVGAIGGGRFAGGLVVPPVAYPEINKLKTTDSTNISFFMCIINLPKRKYKKS